MYKKGDKAEAGHYRGKVLGCILANCLPLFDEVLPETTGRFLLYTETAGKKQCRKGQHNIKTDLRHVAEAK